MQTPKMHWGTRTEVDPVSWTGPGRNCSSMSSASATSGGPLMVTTNLPFDEWTEVFGSERLTGALLDRLTHHIHILEMNGESYRLKHRTSDGHGKCLAPSLLRRGG